MKYLSRNYRKTYRRTSRQKESPHDDSLIAIAISIGIAMLLTGRSSAKPVFLPGYIIIIAILM